MKYGCRGKDESLNHYLYHHSHPAGIQRHVVTLWLEFSC